MNSSAILLSALFDRNNPPRLDQGKRPGTLSLKAIRAFAAENPASFREPRGRVALGLAFLWHDHWKEAHETAQADEGEKDHDLLHAIAHRREKDFANSAYWFRNAGENVAFEILSPRAAKLLMETPAGISPREAVSLREKILPRGVWDAPGFLAAVKKNDFEPLLRSLQAEEIIAFFETLAA